jgi:ankyrin repeat protein
MNPIIKAIYQHNDAAIRNLMQQGADFGFRERDGGTVLMCAVREKDLGLVDLVIKAGASVTDSDAAGWTALHFAAQEGVVEIAEELIRRGAIIDAKDNTGRTPLFVAMLNSKGNGSMICTLIANSANPNIANEKGVSPLKLAESIANFDLKPFLTRATNE